MHISSPLTTLLTILSLKSTVLRLKLHCPQVNKNKSLHHNEHCSGLIIQLLISQSGLGVDNTTFINKLLIEECTSVISSQSLFMLASISAGKCLNQYNVYMN